MNFTDWLTSTFGTAAILGALIWAFWGVIMNRLTASVKVRFDKDLATHIDKLRKETDMALTQIPIDAAKENIKLNRIFESQAEVIAHTYGLLVELQGAYYNLTHNLNPEFRKTNTDVFLAKANECIAYYYPKAVYIPETVADKIGVFIAHLKAAHTYFNFSHYEAQTARKNSEEFQDCFRDFHVIDNQIPALLRELRKNFKDILGIKDQPEEKPPDVNQRAKE